MKDRRPTLCIVHVSLKGGGTGQMESPLSKEELVKLFTTGTTDWIQTDGSNSQEEVASIAIGIKRSELIQFSIIERNKNPIKLTDTLRDIPIVRGQ